MAGEEAAIVFAIQKKIIRKFRDQCATDPRQAMTLESLNIRKRVAVKSLIKKKILVEAPNYRFYLDEEAAEELFKNRRWIFLIVIIFAIIGLLAAYFLNP